MILSLKNKNKIIFPIKKERKVIVNQTQTTSSAKGHFFSLKENETRGELSSSGTNGLYLDGYKNVLSH